MAFLNKNFQNVRSINREVLKENVSKKNFLGFLAKGGGFLPEIIDI